MWVGCIHEIDACEILVRRHYVQAVLARYAHEVGQSGSRTHEYALEAIGFQVVYGDGLAHYAVCGELHAHLPEVVYLHIYYPVGQSEFWDAVFQHTAYFVQGLEHMHLIASLRHVAGKAQSRWARAYYGYFHAVGRLYLWCHAHAALTLEVGRETLKVAYGHSFLTHLEVYALTLALLLLRTYTAADRWQC